MIEKLSEISLFRGVEDTKLMEDFDEIHYKIRDYDVETIIAYAGDNCEYLYVLLEGRVRGEVVNFNGKNVIVDDVHSPNTFAEAFLFASQNNILVNIVATTKSKVLLLPKKEFLKLLHLEPVLLENYLKATANRFITVSQKLRFLTLKTVKQKISHYLLGLKKNNPEKIFFELGKTHASLASLFGITRPVLTKNLLELRKDGIIEIKNKNVRILDEKRLSKY